MSILLYIPHNEIDKGKWDEAVVASSNPKLYLLSGILDVVSPGWCAVVNADYCDICPIPMRQKYGIEFVITPPFVQMMGVLSRNQANSPAFDEFFQLFPSKSRLLNYKVNADNTFAAKNGVSIIRNCNYILELQPSYEELFRGYSRNCRRNILKAKNAGFSFIENVVQEDFVRLVREVFEPNKQVSKTLQSDLFIDFVNACIRTDCGIICGVINLQGDLVAAGLYLVDQRNCTFMVCASTTEGKQNQAMYMLVDSVINKYAGTPRKYDFTGSNDPGIAYFDASFGAKPEYYLQIVKKRFPFNILHLFK